MNEEYSWDWIESKRKRRMGKTEWRVEETDQGTERRASVVLPQRAALRGPVLHIWICTWIWADLLCHPLDHHDPQILTMPHDPPAFLQH